MKRCVLAWARFICVAFVCVSLLLCDAHCLTAQTVSFHGDIVPVLTRAGCNAGACHGAAAGRGGLHLSLFGSHPAEDYRALCRDLEGRRVNRFAPTQSLMLRKPLGELDHGGGQVFDDDSRESKLIAGWLQQGALYDHAVMISQLSAQATLLDAEACQYSIQVMASSPDWTEPRDVTGLSQLVAVDPDSVDMDARRGTVKLLRPGKHVVLVRYLQRIEPIAFIRPFNQQVSSLPLLADNFIDQGINETLEQMHLAAADGIDDAAFMRRVTLDLTGRLPEPKTIEAWLSKSEPDKRHRLVDRLLASVAFNDYWTLRFSQWLHLHSLPNEPDSAKAYGDWIRQAIADGLSWPVMARQLLVSTGDSHQVGPANFSRMVGDARAQAELISEVFMGVRMGCANCHDHPLDQWTQDDYHGLAGMVARIERGRVVRFASRGDVTHPRTSQPARWRLPGDRFVEANDRPLEMLADWLIDPKQPRLATAFANRVWREMFGRGLVDGVADMRVTNPASHPDLLLRLADEVKSHDYDLRSLLRWIVSSRTYARHGSTQIDSFYAHHRIRSLSPHVLSDAISDVTGTPWSFQNKLSGTRAVQVIDPFSADPELNALGRCNRLAACAESDEASGLSIGLHLLNGDFINRRLSDRDGRLMRMIRSGYSTEQIINEIQLHAFGKPPTASELSEWRQRFEVSDDATRIERMEDWLWSILVSDRFQRNH